MNVNVTSPRLVGALQSQANQERTTPEAVVAKALMAYLTRLGHRLSISQWQIKPGDIEDHFDLTVDGRVVAYDLPSEDDAIEMAKADPDYMVIDQVVVLDHGGFMVRGL